MQLFHNLLAQEASSQSISRDIIHALSANGLWIFLSVCVMAAMAKHIAGQVLKYRERVAMIESGMHPDHQDPRVVPIDENERDELANTVDYRNQA